ncbi:hypothetical protein CC78DRAFT_54757 [Lojkania enalia]|uniref:Uncharacterized protein n=1 Tax=Lojkania enalia TaxID=147567 RepID=A0A9P4MZM7_9PLEO|nr:hypothetical protein CC78DRAFT_54757 [Didymosphaeria enalia]
MTAEQSRGRIGASKLIWLYFTSLGSFRQRMYKIFLASHIVLQIAGLAFLWLHYPTSRVYVGTSLTILLIDRLIFKLCLKSSTHPATLTILDDNEALLISANWATTRTTSAFAPRNMQSGWNPIDHIFLTVPSLSRHRRRPRGVRTSAL